MTPMSDLTLQSRVAARPDVVSCELGGGAALLDMESGVYFGLNAIAARIWTHLGSPVQVESILGDLVATYEVEPARARDDLLRTLATLKDSGLIHVVDPEGR